MHQPIPFPRRLPAVAAAVALTFGSHAAHASTGEMELSPLVVTAGGLEQEIERAPASISVITREDLDRRQVGSLSEALEGVQGVNVRSLDARSGKTGNQTISLRGLPSEYTLVLIDGVRQNPRGTVAPNAFNDSEAVFFPPVAAIERIEVIRGPMSTLYGSDALGGVVNVITRRPDNTWSGSVSADNTFHSDSDFGGQSTVEAYGAGPLVEDQLYLSAYGRLFERSASNIDIPGIDQFDEDRLVDNRTMGQNPTSANIETFGAELLFTPDARHDFFLRYDQTEQTYANRRGELGRLNNVEGDPAGNPCATGGPTNPNFCSGYDRELGFNRQQIRVGHVGRFDVGTWETTLTRDFMETTGRTMNAESVPDSDQWGTDRTLELETYILDTQFVTGIGDHLITLGGQYLDPELTDDFFGGDTARVKQYSLFVEDEWMVTDRLTLTGGLRMDDNEEFSAQWSPRVYATFEADRNWTFKGGAGQGFRAPLVEQLSDGVIGFGDGGTTPLEGNPELDPEESTNVEFTVMYNDRDRFRAEATVFRNELKNLIEGGTGANEGQDLNVGRARIQGLELAASYMIRDDLRLSGNYTYIDSEVTRTQLDAGYPQDGVASLKGDPLVSVPDHMVNATIDWQATPQFNTFLTMEYRSSAFRPRNFHEPLTGGSSQAALDDGDGGRDSNKVLGDFRGYTIFDLGGTYRFNDNVRVTGVVQNMLDKDFIRYTGYDRCVGGDCAETAPQKSNRYNSILPGRNVFVSLNVDW